MSEERTPEGLREAIARADRDFPSLGYPERVLRAIVEYGGVKELRTKLDGQSLLTLSEALVEARDLCDLMLEAAE